MSRVSAHEIMGFVATRHGLTMAEFRNHSRQRQYARPRQIAMYAMRSLCPHLSYPNIARILARKDHTTVLHGVRQIESLLPVHDRVSREVAVTLTHFRSHVLDGAAL